MTVAPGPPAPSTIPAATGSSTPRASTPTGSGRAAVTGVVVPLVVGLLIGTTFVAVFLSAFHDPRPHHLPVAVAGPPAVRAAVASLSEQNGDPVDVSSSSSGAAARSAVRDREVLGALVVDASGSTLVVAGANGTAVTQTLQSVFGAAARATRTKLAVVDVQPLTAGDSRGLSVFYGAFGVVLAGFLFGLTSAQTGAGLSWRWRLASILGFSVLAGLVVAWLLGPVFDALPARFLSTACIVGLLALAIGATTTALLRLIGPAGVFVSALLLLVVGNATSTGILPAQYLPAWLEPLAAILPVGVAVRALRGEAYFNGDGLTSAVTVLACWTVAAALVFAGASARQRPPASPPRLETA